MDNTPSLLVAPTSEVSWQQLTDAVISAASGGHGTNKLAFRSDAAIHRSRDQTRCRPSCFRSRSYSFDLRQHRQVWRETSCLRLISQMAPVQTILISSQIMSGSSAIPASAQTIWPISNLRWLGSRCSEMQNRSGQARGIKAGMSFEGQVWKHCGVPVSRPPLE